MGRGSRRSFQIQSKDDITEEAKVIRLRTSVRQYPSDDCRLPRLCEGTDRVNGIFVYQNRRWLWSRADVLNFSLWP